MSESIDKRLADDAEALQSLKLSDGARRALEGRLATARQTRPEPLRRGWQPLAAAAAALVAVVAVTLLLPRETAEDGTADVAVTVPDRTAVRPATRTLPARVPIEFVSQAAPLEDEWTALREDLERARDQIERDLPVRF